MRTQPEATLTHPPAALCTVQRVADPTSVGAAARLLDLQRSWLLSVGTDVLARRPSAREEYTQPDRFYGWPRGSLLVGWVGAKPAGVAGVRLQDDRTAELRRMYVRPEDRRLGLGRLLLQSAVEAAQALQADTLVLETRPRLMPEAVRLYREAGFVAMPQQLRQRLDGAVGMRLDLAAARPV